MIRIGTLEEAYKIFLKIPELEQYLSLDQMRARLACGYLVAVAEHEGVLVGFKIGYPQNNVEFYSWLGGVIPDYRHSGIAQKLLEFQEEWAKNSGFERINVKSMNRFPSMLRLLIKNGYKIMEVESFGCSERERIKFIKSIN